MASFKAIKIGSIVFGVLLIQADYLHPSTVDKQKHQQIDGAMAHVLEFPLLDRSRNRSPNRLAFENLEVWNFVYAHDPLPSLGQFHGIRIAPEHLFSSVLELFVQVAGFPVARSVGMKVHALQDSPNQTRADGFD